MKENSDKNTDSITLLDLINIFLKNKKKIFIFTAIVFVASVIIYFFVLDLIYMSTASIKSTGKSSGLLGSLDMGLTDIGGLEDIGFGGGKSARELAAYEEILLSRRCLEPLIVKFGLMERDKYDFMEEAIKNFREEKLKITQEKLAGVMYISVLDKDKYLAKEMVEFLLEQLDKINIELNVTNARNNREFIESRYLKAKEDLMKAEDSLKSFQLIYGISPDLQTKAAAQSLFTLEAELKAEEVKLDVIKKILSPDQPEVKTQEAKVNSLRDKITHISTSTDLSEFLRLGNSPQIVMEFLRLQRDVEIQNKILTFLLPIYEQAKIEEKRETPTILVLDKPYVADKKTKPKRLTMVLIFTFLSLPVGLSYYVVKHKIQVLRSNLDKS
ncbi:MAG: Wzz/FepE/Etk N-terminal domain-containing protein [Ignavibacteria bacterium]|nr:Wzz/FepE/Etk N-terminal domain-containing protein [Ignavibacteria bacterium]